VKYRLTIDGKTYVVELEPVEEELHRPEPAVLSASPRPMFPPPGMHPVVPSAGAAADESKVCRSPVAGVVVKASIQVGQAIQANDVLMILEAMKMETSITSPVAGKVAKINAAVGDSVQGGQVLVEFE
jgi:biotin carboxyl carrier protein